MCPVVLRAGPPLLPGGRRSRYHRCVFKIIEKDLMDVPLCGDKLFLMVSEPERRRKHEHSPHGAPPRALSALCRVHSLRACPLPCPPARVSPPAPDARTPCCAHCGAARGARMFTCLPGGVFPGIPRWWRSRRKPRVWTDLLPP